MRLHNPVRQAGGSVWRTPHCSFVPEHVSRHLQGFQQWKHTDESDFTSVFYSLFANCWNCRPLPWMNEKYKWYSVFIQHRIGSLWIQCKAFPFSLTICEPLFKQADEVMMESDCWRLCSDWTDSLQHLHARKNNCGAAGELTWWRRRPSEWKNRQR